jgi:SAM-dependent methyltransferase
MFKILNKIQFSPEANKMESVANTDIALKRFNSLESKNLEFLLRQRFEWMNEHINENDVGVEVGSGAGFTKFFIKNKNFKMSDLSEDNHLDFKKVDAQATNFKDQSFDYVIASNMIHHIPYPIKFFKEMNRILKKNGKLIIFEAYSSVLLQIVTIAMRHEGFDFTLNVWDQKKPKIDEENSCQGNK